MSRLLRAFWATVSFPNLSLQVVEVGRESPGDTQDLVNQFGVNHLPVTFFLENGTVVYRRTGFTLGCWSDLRAAVEAFSAPGSFTPPEIEGNLDCGQELPPVWFVNEAGDRTTLPLKGTSPTIILVVSPACPACADVVPWAREFARDYGGRFAWYSVVLSAYDDHFRASVDEALSNQAVQDVAPTLRAPSLPAVDALVEYAKALRLPGQILVDINGQAKRVMGIGALPAVIVLDDAGRVLAKHGVVCVIGRPKPTPSMTETLLLELNACGTP